MSNQSQQKNISVKLRNIKDQENFIHIIRKYAKGQQLSFLRRVENDPYLILCVVASIETFDNIRTDNNLANMCEILVIAP